MEINTLLDNFRDVNLSTILVMIHVIGVALGAGGAMMSDFLFFRNIKEGIISKNGFDSLMTASKVIWLGFTTLVLSGMAMFYLVYIERGSIPMLASSRWQLKLTWVALVFVNGLFFKFEVFGKIKNLIGQSFSVANTGRVLWPIAISGFISIATWYSIIIISLMPRTFRPPYLLVIAIYLAVVLGGSVFAHWVLKRKLSN